MLPKIKKLCIPFSHVSPTRRPNMSARIFFVAPLGYSTSSVAPCSFLESEGNNEGGQHMEN